MPVLSRLAALSIAALAALAPPALADGHASGITAQQTSLAHNTLKAFAYDWYARFDRGAGIEALAPNLPDRFEFVYPQATVTSLADFAPLHAAAQDASVASAHDIEEIRVHPTAEVDLFEIVTPHTYWIERKDGTFGDIDIVSLMRVRLGQATVRDPSGDLPKIEAYRVVFENNRDTDVSQNIAQNGSAGFSVNDAKSFVHQWFAATDARDADAIIARTSQGALNIDLLGTRITSADELRTYLESNSAAQVWATHLPHNISVTPTEGGFAVRFIVHFEGLIDGAGETFLTNVTQWQLIKEDGALRLRDYSLTIL